MPVLVDLASHWPLGEAAGTRYDGYGLNHLTDVNSVGSTTGKIGTAAQFSAGSFQALWAAHHASLTFGDEPFTMGVWIRPTDLNDIRTIFSKGDPSNGEYSLIYRNDPGVLRFEVASSAGFGGFTSVAWSGTLAINTTRLAVVQHDPVLNTLSIQVDNGTPDVISHSAGIYSGTGAFQIGAGYPYAPTFGEHYDGWIDEMFISRKLWTSTELTWLWNGGSGRSWAEWVAESGRGRPMMPGFYRPRLFTRKRAA